MYRALHTLRLALPNRPKFTIDANGRTMTRRYIWPCGCAASGPDEAALAIVCCGMHVDLLAAATSTVATRDYRGPVGE
jgi:hypothetical protein